ncbi:MAG: hypothetical protein WBL35_03990 [Ornithinibacter sp.]
MDYVNSAHVVGRVSGVTDPRALPSGDVVVTVRVVVPREASGVEVEGPLRRRFFRAGGSVASRYGVEARRLRRRRAPARS